MSNGALNRAFIFEKFIGFGWLVNVVPEFNLEFLSIWYVYWKISYDKINSKSKLKIHYQMIFLQETGSTKFLKFIKFQKMKLKK